MAAKFSDNPEQVLPEAGSIESGKSYREKKAKPLMEKIVKVLRSVYASYLDVSRKRTAIEGAKAGREKETE